MMTQSVLKDKPSRRVAVRNGGRVLVVMVLAVTIGVIVAALWFFQSSRIIIYAPWRPIQVNPFQPGDRVGLVKGEKSEKLFVWNIIGDPIYFDVAVPDHTVRMAVEVSYYNRGAPLAGVGFFTNRGQGKFLLKPPAVSRQNNQEQGTVMFTSNEIGQRSRLSMILSFPDTHDGKQADLYSVRIRFYRPWPSLRNVFNRTLWWGGVFVLVSLALLGWIIFSVRADSWKAVIHEMIRASFLGLGIVYLWSQSALLGHLGVILGVAGTVVFLCLLLYRKDST